MPAKKKAQPKKINYAQEVLDMHKELKEEIRVELHCGDSPFESDTNVIINWYNVNDKLEQLYNKFKEE